MALDTALKRLALIPWTLPLPDGTIDAGDRQHLLHLSRVPLAAGVLTGHLLGTLSLVPALDGALSLAPRQDMVHA